MYGPKRVCKRNALKSASKDATAKKKRWIKPSSETEREIHNKTHEDSQNHEHHLHTDRS